MANSVAEAKRLLEEGGSVALRSTAGFHLGPTVGANLFRELSNYDRVTSLDLDGNQLGLEGGKALCAALSTNTRIVSLSVQRNQLVGAVLQDFASLLKSNTTLESIDLGHNALGTAGVEIIVPGLIANHSLKSLSLPGCELNSDSLELLGSFLDVNTSVTTLDLSENNFPDYRMFALARRLATDAKLKTLRLQNCHLGLAGGSPVARALRSNASLTYIDLRKNDLPVYVGAMLIEVLKVNETLSNVRVEDNQFDGPVGQTLQRAVQLSGNARAADGTMRSEIREERMKVLSRPRDQANEIRTHGNSAYKSNQNDVAIQLFTDAISIDPLNEVLYTNRAAAFTAVGQLEMALMDAQFAIWLKPLWGRGYERIGKAFLGLGHSREAIEMFFKGLMVDPNNEALKNGLQDASRTARANCESLWASRASHLESRKDQEIVSTTPSITNLNPDAKHSDPVQADSVSIVDTAALIMTAVAAASLAAFGFA